MSKHTEQEIKDAMALEQPTTEEDYVATGGLLLALIESALLQDAENGGNLLETVDTLTLLNRFAEVLAELTGLERDTVVASIRAYRMAQQGEL